MTNKVAFVIAHYHPEGKVDLYLRNLIEKISDTGSYIVFVSTNISESNIIEINKYAKVITRPNFGYDFWSYKMGIAAINSIENLDKLILLNSSFICLNPEKLINLTIAPSESQCLRGLTMSYDISPHIQSYWLSFESNNLINSPIFRSFWEKMTPISDRGLVIKNYEIGLSKIFISNGINLESIYTPSNKENLIAICRAIGGRQVNLGEINDTVKIITSEGRLLNPTHYLWDSILLNYGIIKLELLKTNPTNQNINTLPNLISKSDITLLNDALAYYNIKF